MSVIVEYFARTAYFDVFAKTIKLSICHLHAEALANMDDQQQPSLDSLETASDISEMSDPPSSSVIVDGSSLDKAMIGAVVLEDGTGGIELKDGGSEAIAAAMSASSNVGEQNAVLKFFGGVLTAAKEKMLGDTWWIPSDSTEIAEIPTKYLLASHLEMERKEDFLVLKGTYSGSIVYHVAIIWKKDGKIYTVWRHDLLAAAKDYVRSVAPFGGLLKYIDNIRDVKMFLVYIGKHPLWKPVHIAARMDSQAFFQEAHMNGTLPSLLNLSCQPEGRYPIHLVVYYNFVDLAKKLFSYGASVAQTDAKGWTALHYGARSSPAMLEVLCAHPESKQCMNALNSDGYTPLFLAIMSCRPTCVVALMNRGAIANVTCQGRSALYEAMQVNSNRIKDVIQTLILACPAAVTEIDPLTGNSLLHTATNKKSLSALCHAAPDMEKNGKNKLGQTALHWHVQKEDLGMVVGLITWGIEIDAQDNDGNTALHLAVSRGNMDIVKALLILGSDANLTNSSGDSAFHLAVRTKNKDKFDIIRCLIICGATQCPKDKQGCTVQCAFRPAGIPPRPPPPYSTLTDVKATYMDTEMPSDIQQSIVPSISEAASAKKDPTGKPGDPKREYSIRTGAGVFAPTTTALSHLDEFIQKKCYESIEQQCKEREEEIEKGKRIRKFDIILTLDGGGIRGLILVQTLLALERALDGEPLLKYVDWLAGTSTGAFLAAALARGKPLRECQHMYLQFKDDIFEGWARPYNADTLEKFIMEMAGAQTSMAHLKVRPKLVITTTAADKIPIKLHLFRNYRLPIDAKENESLGYLDPSEQLLWKALRCSSAAPTYFSSVDNKFVDGGLAANNPTVEVLTEIQRWNNALEYSGRQDEKIRVGCAVSIGTGLTPDIPAESLNFGGLESMYAMRTLGLMLIEQACATEGGPVERARAWLQEMGAPLYRLNPLLSKEYMLDTKDDKEIVAMLWEAEEYAREKAEQFKELASFWKTIKG